MDNMKALYDDFTQGNDDANMGIEEQIAALKSEIRSTDEKIAKLKEELETEEYYNSSAGAADYEVASDALYGMEVVVEEMRNELKEKITEALGNGEIKGDLESLLRNPYKEENFKIDIVGIDGHYAVLSDSERFGKQAIVYENTDRNKCVDYIEERQPAKKPTYYVIENLHDFIKGTNQNIVYGTFEECLQLYQQYTAFEECWEQYNKMCGIQEDVFAAKATVVFGVTTDKNDQDIILNVKGHPFYHDSQAHPIFNDVFVRGEHGTNKYILDDLRVIKAQIEDIQGKEIYVADSKNKDIFAGYSKVQEGQDKNLVNSHVANVNGYHVPCTGYQNRPEITQKLLDKMIYCRDETIMKYEILNDKKEKEILKEIVENKDRKKALMYTEAKAKEESTKEALEAYLQIEAYLQSGTLEPVTLGPDTIEAYLQSRTVEMEKCLDFYNCYFSGIKLEGTFEGANFSNCYFSNCKFENAEFKDCHFKNAILSDVEVKGVSFQNTGFEGADLWSSRFENTQFKEVNFSESNWRQISTVGDMVSFENCDFIMANMKSVHIQGSKVYGELKNIDTISVTLGGATSQEIENHKRMIVDTLSSSSIKEKQIGKKEPTRMERNGEKNRKHASEATSSKKTKKTQTRKRRGKSR